MTIVTGRHFDEALLGYARFYGVATQPLADVDLLMSGVLLDFGKTDGLSAPFSHTYLPSNEKLVVTRETVEFLKEIVQPTTDTDECVETTGKYRPEYPLERRQYKPEFHYEIPETLQESVPRTLLFPIHDSPREDRIEDVISDGNSNWRNEQVMVSQDVITYLADIIHAPEEDFPIVSVADPDV